MYFGIQPARHPAGGVTNVLESTYANGQTFGRGAILTIAAGQISETTPLTASMTNIYGVALQGAATNPGYSAANNPVVITGQRQTVSVAKADANTVFSSLLYNGATQVTSNATLAGLIGSAFGFTKLASGNWVMDQAKTGTSAYATIIDYDQDTKQVFWKFTQTAVTP